MRIKTRSGFSITEILIGVAIIMIIALAFASLTTTMMKEMKGLTQKADAAELRNSMILALSNSNVCSWQLQGRTIRTTGVTSTNASSTTITLQNLYAGLNTNSFVIAQTGGSVSVSQSSLRVASIILRDIFSTGTPNEFIGTFHVSFDESTLVRSIKNATTQVVFIVNPSDPPNARRIVGCTSSGSRSFLLGTPYLRQFHSQIDLGCGNMNTGKMFWDSACHRYCSIGCEVGGQDQICTTPIPGQGYPGGVATECGGSTQRAVCLCLR
ncbi:type IV pilus modification PilV family protein [Bdellovibrio reynosensis]|uniref:Type II secretion system GspH family protein n=1 Tax=Bdellovibrio reynosensis TaxID=2835041 RepID=A0ABY4CDN2_9BACT|nr:type II secretion system protein [Bdellovibrio reynosensis]UOF02899.1 type II secretion system GspH family protein [Bdellovibrio reynosensis]